MQKVYKGGTTFDVVESGILVTPQKTEKFSIGIADLQFAFRFDTRPGDPIGVLPEEVSGKSATFLLVNFDNTLGTAFETSLGNLSSRELWLSLMVHSVNSSDKPELASRQISYTFMLGAPV